MPNRVQIKTEDSASYYTFPINPIEFNSESNDDVEITYTIDGYPIVMKPIFDGRLRTMSWNNLPNKTPYYELVQQLISMKGKKAYIKLRTLSGSPDNQDITYARIVNVDCKWSNQGNLVATGNLVYENIVLSYVPIKAF